MNENKRIEKLQKLFSSIDKIYDDYSNFESQLDNFILIGKDVADVSIGLLEGIEKSLKLLPGLIPVKEKVERGIELLKNIHTHPSLAEKYKVIYNQATVLLVSGFESFMKSLFIALINDFPEMLHWEEKKKAPIELNNLKYFSSAGEAIVSSLSSEFNFQDLQSTLRFLKQNIGLLNIEDDIKPFKEILILNQALRHQIIHNNSVIQHDFLKQIRDTSFFKQYENLQNKQVFVTKEDFNKARGAFREFSNRIFEGLGERMGTEAEK